MAEDDLILEAIIRANKLGAKGTEVIGFLRPGSAISDCRYSLVAQIPKPTTASELMWYDR